MVAATSFSFHFHLPYQSEGHPRQFEGLFISPVGEKNYSRGGVDLSSASEVQVRMQSRAHLAFAEPQPSLAIHLQMHCKGTKKRNTKQ